MGFIDVFRRMMLSQNSKEVLGSETLRSLNTKVIQIISVVVEAL